MHLRCSHAFILAATLFTALSAVAQNPFVGNWKMNIAPGTEVFDEETFALVAGGAIRFSAPNLDSYTFTLDGRSSRKGKFLIIVWKKLDDHTYQSLETAPHLFPATTTRTISADGNSYVRVSDWRLPNGRPRHDSVRYDRVSAGVGLLGTWRNKAVPSKAESIMRWKSTGPNSFSVEDPEEQESHNVVLDGKPHPAESEGLIVTSTRTGPRSFKTTNVVEGQLLSTISFELSPDGQTLTEVATPGRNLPPRTYVYTNVK